MVSFILGMIVFLELGMLLDMNRVKITDYQELPMIITDEKEGLILVKDEERKLLYQNKNLYYKNQKIEYEILEDQQEEIKLKLSKKIKDQEVVMVTIKKKKISLMDMIRNTWGGDNNS